MDLYSDIYRGLPAGGTVTTPGTTGACAYKQNTGDSEVSYGVLNNNQAATLLINIIVAAFKCDAARVMSFKFDAGDYHGNNISHNPFSNNNWQRMADEQSKVFKNLVGPLAQRLNQEIDPANGKSLLYNSLMFSTFEGSEVHSFVSQPAILIGNAGGTLKSGNYIDYSVRSKGLVRGYGNGSEVDTGQNFYGVSYNRIFVTMARALGINPADYEDNSLNVRHAMAGGWGHFTSTVQDMNARFYDKSVFKDPLFVP
jgi:hypothetical protein